MTPRRSPRHGFTLVELVVSIGVLSLLILVIAQLFNGATLTATGSRKRLDADSIARAVFDRMEGDFERIVKRSDVDYDFVKAGTAGAGTTGSNDSMYFYAESSGYPTGASTSGTSASTVSLVGYRINSQYQMERLGQRLAWSGTGGMIFLTNNSVPGMTGTIASDFSTVINDNTPGDPNYYYDVIGDGVFRLELAYLLNDGTFSIIPITNPSGTYNNLAGSGPPVVTSDSTAGFSVGSRWYDTTQGRGYICTSATAGAAAWSTIGIQDVSAVIVALAILDDASRATVTSTAKLAQLAGTLVNPAAADLSTNPPVLMSSKWLNTVNSPGFAQLAGVPGEAASQVRVYQRYFYLNNH